MSPIISSFVSFRKIWLVFVKVSRTVKIWWNFFYVTVSPGDNFSAEARWNMNMNKDNIYSGSPCHGRARLRPLKILLSWPIGLRCYNYFHPARDTRGAIPRGGVQFSRSFLRSLYLEGEPSLYRQGRFPLTLCFRCGTLYIFILSWCLIVELRETPSWCRIDDLSPWRGSLDVGVQVSWLVYGQWR